MRHNLYQSLLFFLLIAFAQTSICQEKKTTKKPTKTITKTVVKKEDSIIPIIPTLNDTIKMFGKMKLIMHNKDGRASYYADKFTGRRTASGARFDNKKYTCAHKKLPFGTKLKITSKNTGKSVVVTVTDRGPFVRGRDVDLSKRAFFDIAPKAYGGSIPIIVEIIK